MPIIKSAIKRMRSDERKRLRNHAVRSELKTLYKKLSQLTSQDVDKAKANVKVLVSKYDKAASKGIIPKQRANRKKSRLALLITRLGSK